MIHTGVRYLPTTNTSWPDFERFPSPICRKCFDLGSRSTRSIAFGGGNGLRGVLDLGRRTDEPFTHDEVDLLVQVARQCAIALENSIAYRELSELKENATTEKLYWKTSATEAWCAAGRNARRPRPTPQFSSRLTKKLNIERQSR